MYEVLCKPIVAHSPTELLRRPKLSFKPNLLKLTRFSLDSASSTLFELDEMVHATATVTPLFASPGAIDRTICNCSYLLAIQASARLYLE